MNKAPRATFSRPRIQWEMVGEGQDLCDPELRLSKLNNINTRTMLQKLNSSVEYWGFLCFLPGNSPTSMPTFGSLSPGGKRPGRGVDHPHPSTAEVKHA